MDWGSFCLIVCLQENSIVYQSLIRTKIALDNQYVCAWPSSVIKYITPSVELEQMQSLNPKQPKQQFKKEGEK